MCPNHPAAFRARYERLLANPSVAGAAIVRLPANVPPWTDVGLEIEPGDEVRSGPRDTATRRSDRRGRLELGVYEGEWSTRTAGLATAAEAYASLGGGYDVVAICWRGRAADGIAALRATAPDDPLLAAESAGLAAPVLPPSTTLSWRWRVDPLPTDRADARIAIAHPAFGDVLGAGNEVLEPLASVA